MIFLVQYTFTFAERQYCAYPIDYQRVYKDRRRKSDLIPLTLPDHQAHLSDAFFPFFFVFARTLASSHSAMPVLRYLKEVYAVLLLNHHPGRHPSTTSKVYAGP